MLRDSVRWLAAASRSPFSVSSLSVHSSFHAEGLGEVAGSCIQVALHPVNHAQLMERDGHLCSLHLQRRGEAARSCIQNLREGA